MFKAYSKSQPHLPPPPPATSSPGKAMRAHQEGQWVVGAGRPGEEEAAGSLPEVVEVQLLSAVLVWLTLSALASRKLKLASRSGQKGSIANLEEAGPGSEDLASTKVDTHRTHSRLSADRRVAGMGVTVGPLWER